MTADLEALKRRLGAEQLLQLADSEGLRHYGTRCECPGCRNGDARGVSIAEKEGVGLWHCKRNDEHRGTAIDFVMLARDLSLPAAIAELKHVAEGMEANAVAPRYRVPILPRTYPPAGEVAQLWASARPLSEVIDVAEEWRERGLDVAAIKDRDLARALPWGMPVPKWARTRILIKHKPWSEWSYRLLLPMFDASGALVTLHARAAKDADPKGVHACGFKAGGAIMADASARQLLLGAGTKCDVLIGEGGPDFLAWATHWSDAAENAPAVFAVLAGSWTAQIATRIPDGSRVCVATHEDLAGDKYAEDIRATLARRCRVLRFGYEACLPPVSTPLREAA